MSSFKSWFSFFNLEFSIALFDKIINLSLLKGFSKKSYAPFLIALTARSTVPWPLIIITGIFLLIFLNSFKISIPSNLLFDSHTSRITKSGLFLLKLAIASSEFWAV